MRCASAASDLSAASLMGRSHACPHAFAWSTQVSASRAGTRVDSYVGNEFARVRFGLCELCGHVLALGRG